MPSAEYSRRTLCWRLVPRRARPPGSAGGRDSQTAVRGEQIAEDALPGAHAGRPQYSHEELIPWSPARTSAVEQRPRARAPIPRDPRDPPVGPAPLPCPLAIPDASPRGSTCPSAIASASPRRRDVPRGDSPRSSRSSCRGCARSCSPIPCPPNKAGGLSCGAPAPSDGHSLHFLRGPTRDSWNRHGSQGVTRFPRACAPPRRRPGRWTATHGRAPFPGRRTRTPSLGNSRQRPPTSGAIPLRGT